MKGEKMKLEDMAKELLSGLAKADKQPRNIDMEKEVLEILESIIDPIPLETQMRLKAEAEDGKDRRELHERMKIYMECLKKLGDSMFDQGDYELATILVYLCLAIAEARISRVWQFVIMAVVVYGREMEEDSEEALTKIKQLAEKYKKTMPKVIGIGTSDPNGERRNRYFFLTKVMLLAILLFIEGRSQLEWHEKIAFARRIKRMTLRDLQEVTGISNSYLSQIESGKIEEPSVAKILPLMVFFNLELSDLFTVNNSGKIEERIQLEANQLAEELKQRREQADREIFSIKPKDQRRGERKRV
jgi:transcriptional regulator with XRE-family HTH domain/cell division protein ZapA (FtsZ GTPase activity inhibitor)